MPPKPNTPVVGAIVLDRPPDQEQVALYGPGSGAREIRQENQILRESVSDSLVFHTINAPTIRNPAENSHYFDGWTLPFVDGVDAVPGAVVELYLNGRYVGNAIADNGGNWSVPNVQLLP